MPDRNTVHGWVEETPDELHLRRQGAPRAVAPLGAARVAAARPARGARTSARAGAADPGARDRAGGASRGGDRAARARPASFGAYLAPAHARRSARGSTSSRSSTAWSPHLRPHGLAVELRNRGWVRTSGARADPRAGSRTATSRSSTWTRRPDDHFSIMPPIDAVTNPTDSPTCARTGATRDGYLTGKTVAERFGWQLRRRGAGGDRRACQGTGRARRRGARGVQQQPRRRRADRGAALPLATRTGAGGRGRAAQPLGAAGPLGRSSSNQTRFEARRRA